jgi:DNA-binding NarL/FixJ family response regulator
MENKVFERVRVLIVDDHTLVREGLSMFLSEEDDSITVVGQAGSGEEALPLAATLAPDVVLMDLVMPGIDGIETLRRMRATAEEHGATPPRVLILTSFADDARVREAIRAGATGYLLKDMLQPELVQAIHDAARGKPTLHPEAQQHLMRQFSAPPTPRSPLEDLTDREQDVLRLIAQGHSNKEIAATLHLTLGTVKGYVSAILSKLGVADRTQATLFAIKYGLIKEVTLPEGR